MTEKTVSASLPGVTAFGRIAYSPPDRNLIDLYLDGGIGFYNSQSMVSVTPIHDFQQQIAQDPQGQRAAQLYYFSATTYDWSNLTITAVASPAAGNLLYPGGTGDVVVTIANPNSGTSTNSTAPVSVQWITASGTSASVRRGES